MTDLDDALERFASEQEDKPDREEAIRRILTDWLIGHRYLPPEAGEDG